MACESWLLVEEMVIIREQLEGFLQVSFIICTRQILE